MPAGLDLVVLPRTGVAPATPDLARSLATLAARLASELKVASDSAEPQRT